MWHSRLLGSTLASLAAIATIGGLSAQNVAEYTFAETGENSYTSLAGSTASTATGDDGSQNNIPIGFDFQFGPIVYSTFSINTNGWIRMGGSIPSGSFSNGSLNFTGEDFRPLIAPFWDDNNRGTGLIHYAVSGLPGSRVLIVDWNLINLGGSGNTSSTEFGSFQVWLFEGTNVIKYSYATVMNPAGTLTATIGISGPTGFVSVTPGPASTSSSATVNSTISSTTGLAGKTYTFTPTGCASSSSFGSGAVTTIGGSVTLTTCLFGGEYSIATGLVGANTYIITASGGTGNYLTIRTTADVLIQAGPSPQVLTGHTGDIRVLVNTDAACGTESECHTLAVATSDGAPDGISNSTSFADLRIFPNPANDHLQLVSARPGTTCIILNMAGQVLLTHTTTSSTEQIDVSALAPGLYVLKMPRIGPIRFVIAR